MKTLLCVVTAILLLCSPGEAEAYDGLDLYSCRISARDRVNSRGGKLFRLRDILAQDRANYHKFGRRDRVDEWDGFCQSAANRQIFQFARIRISPNLKRRILAGENVNLSVFILTRTLIDVQEGLLDPNVG